MYVYINSEPGLYTVGFYDPKGNWHAESDHNSQEAAGERVHFLNGGAQDDGQDVLDEQERNYNQMIGNSLRRA